MSKDRLFKLFLVVALLLLGILVGAAVYLPWPDAVVLGATQPLAPQRPCRVEHAFARMRAGRSSATAASMHHAMRGIVHFRNTALAG
ncbi:hypothetical protein AB0L67_27060 [Streptomyces flaveolus]|uniref:hypothetical protein n=1 Tax=Streptomyces flaveolus TaxID=67297 RepID=UPI003427C74C